MSKLSNNSVELTAAFVAAQTDLVSAALQVESAVAARNAAFICSALAASAARKGRVTLQKLADANKSATAELAATAPKGTLLVSLVGVTVHSYVGDAFGLPEAAAAEGETVTPVDPYKLQTSILKLYKIKGAGVKAIGAAIKGAKTRQDVADRIDAAIDTYSKASDADAAGSAGGAGDDETDGETFGGSDDIAPVTVETLLSQVLAMIGEQDELSADALSMIGQLSELANVPALTLAA